MKYIFLAILLVMFGSLWSCDPDDVKKSEDTSEESGGGGGGTPPDKPGPTNPVVVYMITFDANGGDDVADIDVNNGELVDKIPVSKREGYYFEGWYNQDLSEVFDFTKPISANFKVYAKWSIQSRELLLTAIKEVLGEKPWDMSTSLNSINTSRVTDMSELFVIDNHLVSFNGDISKWDTSSVKNMSKMFYGNTVFNKELNGWDVSNVTDMSEMFKESAFDGIRKINTWKTSSLENMRSMFASNTKFNGSDITRWDVSKVTNMGRLFESALVFNQDISSWETGNVTNMNLMFYNARVFYRDISKWDVNAVTDYSDMFTHANAMNANAGFKPTFTK